MSSKKEIRIDLQPDHLAEVKAILAKHVPEFEVRVFGSRVTPAAKPASDLDLAVMTSSPLPLDRMARLREAFQESNLPFKVDVVDWADTSDSFRRIIEETFEVLQERPLR